MPLAVAIAGRMGSGKTTLALAISTAFGWPRASFGDYVRSEVMKRGLSLSRNNLQVIGTELLEADVPLFCSRVLAGSGWRPGQGLVIDGLRHSETIDPICKLIYPLPLKIVLIEVDDLIRKARLAQKGESGEIAVREADAHSSEKQVATTFERLADLIVDGSQTPGSIFKEVAEWIGEQRLSD